MIDKSVQLNYTFLLLPAAILMLLARHYFTIQCEAPLIIGAFFPAMGFPLATISISLILGVLLLVIILVGLNMARPMVTTSLVLATLLFPLGTLALTASNSYANQWKSVSISATTDRVLTSHPVNLSMTEYNLINVQEQMYKTALGADIQRKRQMRSLYSKLQEELECCGVSGYLDCTGILPAVEILDVHYHQQNSSKNRFVNLTGVSKAVNKNIRCDTRRETCVKVCPKISIPCTEEIKSTSLYCKESITSVMIAYYIVFLYTLGICWYYVKQQKISQDLTLPWPTP